jgi:hypothetical protein
LALKALNISFDLVISLGLETQMESPFDDHISCFLIFKLCFLFLNTPQSGLPPAHRFLHSLGTLLLFWVFSFTSLLTWTQQKFKYVQISPVSKEKNENRMTLFPHYKPSSWLHFSLYYQTLAYLQRNVKDYVIVAVSSLPVDQPVTA